MLTQGSTQSSQECLIHLLGNQPVLNVRPRPSVYLSSRISQRSDSAQLYLARGLCLYGRQGSVSVCTHIRVCACVRHSEMAPPHLRGRSNQLYQLVLTFFILVAQVINLIINVTKAVRWGWRFSLGFAFVPSFLLFLGGVFLPDSPNSLLERGKHEQVTLTSSLWLLRS